MYKINSIHSAVIGMVKILSKNTQLGHHTSLSPDTVENPDQK